MEIYSTLVAECQDQLTSQSRMPQQPTIEQGHKHNPDVPMCKLHIGPVCNLHWWLLPALVTDVHTMEKAAQSEHIGPVILSNFLHELFMVMSTRLCMHASLSDSHTREFGSSESVQAGIVQVF